MEISEIDQEVSDFDWFAVDCDGYLVHFASTGNQLPNSVAASKEELDLLQSYFLALPSLFSRADIFMAPTQAPFSFLEYAFRGLISYDAILLDGPMNTTYKILARPPRIASIHNLPLEIANLIAKTQLGISIIGLDLLDTKAVA